MLGDDGSDAARLAAGISGLIGVKGILVHAYPNRPEVDLGGRGSEARTVDSELRREERTLVAWAAGSEETLASPRIASWVPPDGEAEMTLIAVGSRGLGMSSA